MSTDEAITALTDRPSSPTQASKQKAKVFISYSRKDMAFADRLETALKDHGFEPLIDRTEIYAFEDWWKRIQALIVRADTVIFILSPDAVTSEVCTKEVVFAASLNKRFAPIVARRVDDKLVPEPLARLNFIFFDEETKFAASFKRLCEALATDIEWIRKHTQYGEAARHWAAAGGRAGGLLLRSPVLEEAERWIASRPPAAPEATEETRTFIAESRRGATRRRNILTGSLAAGLVVALVLAGIAYWQRGVAVEQQKIASQQRDRAEHTLALATRTTNGLVFDLAQKFRDVVGVPAATVKDILDRARQLQDQLLGSGETSPDLRFSQAVALGEISTTLLAIGETQAALAAAQQDQEILQSLADYNPANTDYQLNLSVAHHDVGNVQLAMGDLPSALASYQASLAIRERLVKSDPGNTDWQHYLAVAYDRIGGVLLNQGNLSGALAAYQAAHELVDRLARSRPDNLLWQGDLEVSYEKLGDVQSEQGELAAALVSYQQRLAITERLVRADPGNSGWQRDLYLAYSKLARVQMARSDLPAALASYEASLAVIDRLARSDPGRAEWQRDLALAHASLGDAYSAKGDLSAALGAYRRSLEISQRLANADPRNTDWQTDMAATYERIGNVQMQQGDLPAALASYQASLAITERLTEALPKYAGLQADLALIHVNIGRVQEAQGNPEAALVSYQAGLAIMEPLAKSDPSNAVWRRRLFLFYVRTGDVLFNLQRPQEALAHFRAAIESGQSPDPSALYFRCAVIEIELDDGPAAVKDAATALKLKPTDPYYVLWLHAARVHGTETDAAELANNARQIDRSKWPWPIAALFLGLLNTDELQAAASSADEPSAKINQSCEADFFTGIYYVEKSAPAAARSRFQSALDHCPRRFFEFLAAKFELQRLDALLTSRGSN